LFVVPTEGRCLIWPRDCQPRGLLDVVTPA
jgi:hypothetical protein